MSKWPGCPVTACKNDLCHTECQKKRQREIEEARDEGIRQAIIRGGGYDGEDPRNPLPSYGRPL
jgi:hypothetical protein